jgi:hypothetical protein
VVDACVGADCEVEVYDAGFSELSSREICNLDVELKRCSGLKGFISDGKYGIVNAVNLLGQPL